MDNNNFNNQSVNNLNNINQIPNNNVEPILNQNTNNVDNKNKKDNKNNKKIIIIFCVLVVAIILSLLLIFNKKESNSQVDLNNNTTIKSAEIGNTLEINEMDGIINFDIRVDSVDDEYSTDNIWYTGDCYAVKININNKNDSDLTLSGLVKFEVVDSADNKLGSWNSIMASSFDDNSIPTTISAQSSEKGYLYFVDYENSSNIDTSSVAKLKISVINNLEKNGTEISGDYSYYYINLK